MVVFRTTHGESLAIANQPTTAEEHSWDPRSKRCGMWPVVATGQQRCAGYPTVSRHENAPGSPETMAGQGDTEGILKLCALHASVDDLHHVAPGDRETRHSFSGAAGF